MKLVWTQQARDDLAAIHAFIAADSPYYAAQVIETLLGVEQVILEQPLAGGRVREKPRRDIRQVRRYHYRVIYRLRAHRIDVLTIVHAKRNLTLEINED